MNRQIINALKANQAVTGWLLSETKTISSQAFYVMQQKETTRRVETDEYQVTVYRRHGENGAFVGASSFAIGRKLTKRELDARIADAVYAAQFVKNKAFEPVKGEGKRTWKEKTEAADPYELLDGIAKTFFAASTQNARFNALETFHVTTIVRIQNSNGIDLTKTQSKVDVEAIPSYDGPGRKVELIRMFTYRQVDFDLVKADAETAIADVGRRFAAKGIEGVAKADVILQGEDVAEFFGELIADYSYDGVYRHTADKRIGDMIQKDIQGDALSIGWTLSSKADAFDRDGVLLAPVRVVENGRLVGYYGANQYAQYLGMKPAGVFTTLEVAKGSTTVAKMKQKPHLEIIALSGIQIETYSGYIGGEVRLAVWFDGKEAHPVSGFSFSGNIDKALATIATSKETLDTPKYRGPKYVRLRGMDIL